MKKIKIGLLCLLVLGLLGCTNQDTSNVQTSQATVGHSINRSEYLPELPAAVPIDKRAGDFTMYEYEYSFYGFPGDVDDIISIEEAAMIVAEYILEVLGDDLDGKYMVLHMNYNHNINFSTWNVLIYDYVEDVVLNHNKLSGNAGNTAVRNQRYTVLIDALTGRRLILWNEFQNALAPITEIDFHDFTQARLNELFPRLADVEVEHALEAATIFATRHFSSAGLAFVKQGRVDVPFSSEGSPMIEFYAVCVKGNMIELLLCRNSLELVNINTPINHQIN